jgi:hypothetical protein
MPILLFQAPYPLISQFYCPTGVNVVPDVLRPPVHYLKCRMGPPTRIQSSHWPTGAPLANGENALPDRPEAFQKELDAHLLVSLRQVVDLYPPQVLSW